MTTVAFSFHWDAAAVAPEARSALPHYRAAIEALAADPDRPYRMLGHAHPRAWLELAPWYARLGIDATAEADDVMQQADLLVADNTSLLYEFAALDRPVVVLNAPWYRRDVDHQGRFWRWADVGVQVDEPDELTTGIFVALRDDPPVAKRRRAIVAEVYSGGQDGRASERAVDAIHSVIGAAMRRPPVSQDPYAAQSTVFIGGFTPRLQTHPPIPRLAYLGAPPELVAHVRKEWETLSEADRLTSVEMFDHLTDDEVRAKIAEGMAELAAEAPVVESVQLSPGTPAPAPRALVVSDAPPSTATAAVVLGWVGEDAERAGWWLAVEVAGQNRSTLIKRLTKIAARG